ncbi:MAG: TonB-dependent receptor [Bacteroidota bacterium]|nr:TonB-dependent receptor [Bacteroidota bacterium]
MKNFLKCFAACMLLPAFVFAQNDVTGKVTNAETGEPIIGCIVRVTGSYSGASTDVEGNFIIKNVKGNTCCLELSYIAFVKDTFCFNLPMAASQAFSLLRDSLVLEEIIVNSTRANENSALAYTTLSRKDLAALNFGQDLPYLLDQTPSVVTTSDAGTGFGYTGIRIRGSDNTRVNVTINGIPVNDAESQGTYWVDLPDVVSSVDNIQIQRGAGTSTNGAGAFGGSINIQTDGVQAKPYGELMTSGGSFNTFRTTMKAGTGMMNNGWSFDTRLSKINSDGFIDRSAADLSSWYVSGAWFGKDVAVKAIAFSGREKTYQSWYGIPEDSIKAGKRTFNPAGMYFDANGTIKYYDNQTDNYRQDYYQLHFLFHGNENWNFNAALHATRGIGFYEEYREDDDLANYGFDTSVTTDLVRRKWLDNWFYGMTYGAQYDNHKKTTLIIGGAINNYEGQHYDQIIWAQFLPVGTEPVHQYDFNFAHKLDGNIFARMNYQVTSKLNAFVDLQFRKVAYHFTGIDTTGAPIMADETLNFLNPKAGLTFRPNGKHTFYYSFSTAQKEPNRDDYRNSTVNSRPLPEELYDNEAGWKYGNHSFSFAANLYYMHYINQLVLTGKVNDVGAYTRVNVPKSYRTGIELEANSILFNNSILISGNYTYSMNKISNYLEYLDDYDNGGQMVNIYSNTDIAFSPSSIASLSITYKKKGFNAMLSSKYVSEQFLDNTSNDLRKLDGYTVANLRVSYTFKPKSFKEITAAVLVNNLFDKEYSSNGYTYGYIYGGETSYYNNYFPQAGINFLGMLTLKF